MRTPKNNRCIISYIMYGAVRVRSVFGGDARTSGEDGLSVTFNNEMRPDDAMVERLRDRRGLRAWRRFG
jgi:hypothetical protein